MTYISLSGKWLNRCAR